MLVAFFNKETKFQSLPSGNGTQLKEMQMEMVCVCGVLLRVEHAFSQGHSCCRQTEAVLLIATAIRSKGSGYMRLIVGCKGCNVREMRFGFV